MKEPNKTALIFSGRVTVNGTEISCPTCGSVKENAWFWEEPNDLSRECQCPNGHSWNPMPLSLKEIKRTHSTKITWMPGRNS